MIIRLLLSALFMITLVPSISDAEIADRYDDMRIKYIPVAIQCWTFHNFTFMETIDRVQAMGVQYLQPYPGQRIGGDFGDATFGPDLTDEQMERIRIELGDRNITLVAFGVIQFDDDEQSMERLFGFAKKMGIPTIVTEPRYDDWSRIERMVRKYNIKVAIHNHPHPSKYAFPATVMSRLHGLDPRIGVSADTGHWMRSGVRPIDALRTLDGRIMDVHLKDLAEFNTTETHDVPFGSGLADVRTILAELTRQGYQGYITVEHENPAELDNPEPSVLKGIEYLASVTDYDESWKPLIQWNGGQYTKHGWNHYGPGYFTLDAKTGILSSRGGMGLFWYAERYDDFVIDLEYRTTADVTNSGVFLRVPEMPANNSYIYHSYEIQIDNSPALGKNFTGAVYDAEPPTSDAARPTGEWNHFRITFDGNRITVVLNGTTVVDKWNAVPRGKVRDIARDGYIGLQNHDDRAQVQFRNIYLKEL
jgi:sugar phosphate isomerase/epimerase